ncbi:hypothetical protein DFP72DRAFT_862935 [Ephemerocybe angulata]|uniref:Uncharacterized protein n=1 Tax=Ephemerocybe angulata TaxID=980116 RepID=A0A8H6H643_9AGAR|nr:hypothetical protein DFP72DRAFT_862935 [Tulosesus angulatus]
MNESTDHCMQVPTPNPKFQTCQQSPTAKSKLTGASGVRNNFGSQKKEVQGSVGRREDTSSAKGSRANHGMARYPNMEAHTNARSGSLPGKGKITLRIVERIGGLYPLDRDGGAARRYLPLFSASSRPISCLSACSLLSAFSPTADDSLCPNPVGWVTWVEFRGERARQRHFHREFVSTFLFLEFGGCRGSGSWMLQEGAAAELERWEEDVRWVFKEEKT